VRIIVIAVIGVRDYGTMVQGYSLVKEGVHCIAGLLAFAVVPVKAISRARAGSCAIWIRIVLVGEGIVLKVC
jgi:hypothetical protein